MKTTSYDHERDLLTAALIGLAAGIAATFLLRQGPSGRRPLAAGMSMAGEGARWAKKRGATSGRRVMKQARRGVERGMERGADLIDDVPLDEWKEQIGGYLEAFKGAIQDTVHEELQDLRKSMRRQRRRFGV